VECAENYGDLMNFSHWIVVYKTSFFAHRPLNYTAALRLSGGGKQFPLFKW